MNINLKKVSNPYSILALSWCMCLILYSLGWSQIFPAITFKLAFFISIIVFIFFLAGYLFNKIFKNQWLGKYESKPFHKYLLIINAIIFIPNFFYSGVPLMSGLRDMEFGIPTIVVIATTLNSFTIVYCFYLFLTFKKKRFIVYSLFCLIFFVLVISRGNIMMSFVTMFFLWMNTKMPKLTFKKSGAIIGGLFIIMFLFGAAGNYRTINDLNNKIPTFDNSYNSNVIMSLGGASDSFKESIIPGEFFWSYIYITSPLSNLQFNINKYSPEVTFNGVIQLIINEVLFDTVSKRIDDILNITPKKPDLLVDALTVPTTFAESYIYAGWWGMILFSVVLFIFPFLYAFCVLNNPLGIIGISILCTAYFFSIFDNMFILTGLTFQIFYPIIFNFLGKIKLKNELTN